MCCLALMWLFPAERKWPICRLVAELVPWHDSWAALVSLRNDAEIGRLRGWACLAHKKRNILDKVPDSARPAWSTSWAKQMPASGFCRNWILHHILGSRCSRHCQQILANGTGFSRARRAEHCRLQAEVGRASKSRHERLEERARPLARMATPFGSNTPLVFSPPRTPCCLDHRHAPLKRPHCCRLLPQFQLHHCE